MTVREDVSRLMREVADAVVLPRFRALAAHEIVEKSPGEIVTTADREAELRLNEGLARILPEARIVGEEACDEDPALLNDIGSGLVWLIDPVDGTSNFANGRTPFGMMVALVADGEPVAGWMLDPISGRMCQAARGVGATIDGRPVRARCSGGPRPVASLATQFMDAGRRARVHMKAERRYTLEPIPRCAAESYPRLVLGRNDVALFQRILPWDHAAGVLFLTEAGGHATHWDRTPYRIGSGAPGLLVAASHLHWDAAAATLLDAVREIATPEPLAA